MQLLVFLGTCKIQKNCTSTIRTDTRMDGKILLDMCYIHYGHDIDLQHTWLPKRKREKITAQIQQGVSMERILGDIREEGIQHELKRYHPAIKEGLVKYTILIVMSSDIQMTMKPSHRCVSFYRMVKKNCGILTPKH